MSLNTDLWETQSYYYVGDRLDKYIMQAFKLTVAL